MLPSITSGAVKFEESNTPISNEAAQRKSKRESKLLRSATVADLRSVYDKQEFQLTPLTNMQDLHGRIKHPEKPKEEQTITPIIEPIAPSSIKLDLTKITKQKEHSSEDKSPNKGPFQRATSVGSISKIKRGPTFSNHLIIENKPQGIQASEQRESPLRNSMNIRMSGDSPVKKVDSARRSGFSKEPSMEEIPTLQSPKTKKWNIFAKFHNSFTNEKVRKKFEQSWTENKLYFNESEAMWKFIANFCRVETDKTFDGIKDPSNIPCGHLLSSESPRSREILDQFLKNWNLLKTLIAKFKNWENILIQLHQKENPTPLTAKLQGYLTSLIRIGEPLILPRENPQSSETDILQFIKKIDLLLSEDKEVSRFIMSVWKGENVNGMLDVLRECPAVIKDVHHNRSWEIISVSNILQRPPLLWKERPNTEFAISKISLREVTRCIPQFTKGSFTINGCEPAIPEYTDDINQQKRLLVRILDILYNPETILRGMEDEQRTKYAASIDFRPDAYLIGKPVSGIDIQEQVEKMFALELLPWDHPLKPGELLLRLMTMSCWNRGDDIIKLRYPELFNPPYLDKRDNSTCHINVLSPGNFSCTQIKCYDTHYRIRPEDRTCRVIRENSLSLKTWFSWTVYPCQDDDSEEWYWGGEQAIQKVELTDNVSNAEERRRFLNILNNPQINADQDSDLIQSQILKNSSKTISPRSPKDSNKEAGKARDTPDGKS